MPGSASSTWLMSATSSGVRAPASRMIRLTSHVLIALLFKTVIVFTCLSFNHILLLFSRRALAMT
ncbi:hypothetical protein, partial [Thiolapillus sp.]|uniref:hypothetical protein n=1 Tax=Thiolapillus sp. TaxID=2017437 RepID=UPI003AF8C808